MRVGGLAVVVITLLFLNGIRSEPSNAPASSKPTRAHRKVLVKRTPVSRTPRNPAPLAAGPAPAAEGPDELSHRLARRDAHNSRPVRDSYIQIPDWVKGIFKLNTAEDTNHNLSPILVLPIPVSVGKDNSKCDANQHQPERYHPQQEPDDFLSRGDTRRPRPPPAAAPPAYNDDYDEPAPAPAPRPSPFRVPTVQVTTKPDPFNYQHTAQPPRAEVPSRILIEKFQAQKPTDSHLPPVLIRHRRLDAEQPPRPVPQPLPADEASAAPPQRPGLVASKTYILPPGPSVSKDLLRTPPLPRFERPLMLRGEVTVQRAGYTEPYTAWWDAASGEASMQMHGGSSSMYRMVSGEGRVKRAVTVLDRSTDRNVVRCSVMPQSTLSPTDKIPPVLPDTKDFSFKEYVRYGEVKAEVWKQTVSGSPGEMGGARGEALTFRHELLVARAPDNSPKPLMYSVGVDSSVLGPDCDGHVHRYHEVREEQHDPQRFQIDLAKTCDTTEQTEDMFVVEPLREYTMMQRAPRYDDLFKQFSIEFERKYVDSAEEAVRKNLFVQTSRFISSGNRLGATFQMEVNFIADRLDAELQALQGVAHDAEHFPSETFPHERAELRDLETKLPKGFDWRERGGVSPVRYQMSCESCWAFAVVGAVEGALFRRTRRLVPLSEQSLVDCAGPYGGNGCVGTWPTHAYDYIKDRGLPALDEYTPYQNMVAPCQDKRVPPVTYISAHVNVTAFSVPALKVAIRNHAPSVVIIDITPKSFQLYKSGIYFDDRCAKVWYRLKHAVLAVGWGEGADGPHFILKNSWSDRWGDGGYVRVHGPSNTCGVLTIPSYPRLEADDVRAASAARA